MTATTKTKNARRGIHNFEFGVAQSCGCIKAGMEPYTQMEVKHNEPEEAVDDEEYRHALLLTAKWLEGNIRFLRSKMFYVGLSVLEMELHDMYVRDLADIYRQN